MESMPRVQLKAIEEENERLKVRKLGVNSVIYSRSFQKAIQEMQVRYDREQRLMLSYVHNIGEQRAREHLASQNIQQKFGPTSWLAQQRRDVSIFSIPSFRVLGNYS